MKNSEFQKYLKRDLRCYHCGKTDDTLIPQHRINRQMGGSKKRDVPSNIITLCSRANGWLESSADFSALGKKYGWKLESWQSPHDTPVLDFASGLWFVLDDNYNRRKLEI
jgi:hypothetical protein